MPRAFNDVERARIRARLLAHGRKVAAGRGFRRTPVADFSKAVGISKGAFYQFFERKEQLLITLLLESEASLRGQIDQVLERGSDDALIEVLGLMFDAVVDHPILGALNDPEEYQWLVRSLPPQVFLDARADDDRYFGGVLMTLREAGLVGPLSVDVFAGLAPAALALAQQRSLIGEDRADAVRLLIVEALALRCAV